MPRLEDPRLLRGRGRFADDLDLPHMLHAAVVRSPYPHARVLGVDAGAARRRSGVAAVLTRADLGDRARPIPIRLCPDDALNAFLQHPLAGERVRYAGEPVALVVAESRALAEDAAETVEVDYEPLPVCADPEAAPAAALFDAAPDNLASEIVEGFGDVEGAFARAAHVVETTFATSRHTAVPMETRGLVAWPDQRTDRLCVFGPTKVTHFNRRVLAAMLGWPEHRVSLLEPDVGGGFGVRGEFYPEDFLVPFAALTLGRPVKWIEDRLEHLTAANHSREQRYRIAGAFGADGEWLGLRADAVVDMGGYLRTHGTIVPGLSAGMLPGPYRIGAYRGRYRCMLTNKTPTGTYRAPGRFECNAARERLLDRAAEAIGLDPIAIRGRNLLRPDELPRERGTRILGEAVVLDGGDYPGALAEAARLSDFARRRAVPPGAGRWRRGVGLACFVEKTGTGPFEGARVRIDPTGAVVVATGAASVGQGLETCLAQIAADALGVEPGAITVRHGDTDLIDHGIGSFASRGTVMAGSAVHVAATRLAGRIRAVAARLLGAPGPDAIEAAGGGCYRWPERGTETALPEIAAAAGPAVADEAGERGLDVTHYFRTERMTYSNGVAVAEVRVDTRTGQVHPETLWLVYDVGRAINPRLVEGQVAGGAVQGLGGALLEDLRYDEDGQLLAGTLADYLLPGCAETPRLVQRRLEHAPSVLNPLGVKGAGEVGIAGVGGAVANAVAHALGPGVAVDRLPLTPERVWRWARGEPEDG